MSTIDYGTIPDYQIDAVYIGPIWQRDESGQFILPERTLGWQILRWIKTRIKSLTGIGFFQPTKEQARFILWWYAVDEQGRFVYRDGILQRLKGWLPMG